MDLAGHLLLLPAAPLPTIASTRPRHLPRLVRGRSVAQAVALLPSLFTLCAGAHRLAARLATQAAQGPGQTATPAMSTSLQRLQRETLAEHLRRLWLDAPVQLGAPPADAASLQQLAGLLNGLRTTSPATPSEPSASIDHDALPAVDPSLPDAVLEAVFGTALGSGPETAHRVAAAIAARDDATLAHWYATGDTPAARALGRAAARCRALATAADPALPAHADPAFLAACDQALDRDDDFESAPLGPQGPAETGPWTRHGLPAPRHALDRLLGRLVEVLRLAEALAPARAPAAEVLAAGAWSPAPGRGLGWAQMARGLLIHRATVSGVGPAACVDDYRVLAPTEWNFHPRGAAARALAALRPGDDLDADTARIAAAFDPCVRHQRVEALPPTGAPHA